MHRPESRASVQTSKREKYSLMARIDAHEIRFQCPKCGHDLKQTIGRLKANERMTCPGCGVRINIDTDRLAKATEEIEKALKKIPPEITIKFFR
jgi:transcription elongation factor Elf1